MRWISRRTRWWGILALLSACWFAFTYQRDMRPCWEYQARHANLKSEAMPTAPDGTVTFDFNPCFLWREMPLDSKLSCSSIFFFGVGFVMSLLMDVVKAWRISGTARRLT